MQEPSYQLLKRLPLRQRLSIKQRFLPVAKSKRPADFSNHVNGLRGFSVRHESLGRSSEAAHCGSGNGQVRGLLLADQIEQAKLDAMKELAYGASHEINNPLANIAARAQTLLRDERDERRRGMLEAMHRQAMRAHEMISDLMLFARPPRLERSEFDLLELVQEVVEELRPLAVEQETELIAKGDNGAIFADRVQLGVAIKALVQNSVEALSSGGEVGLAVQQSSDGTQLTVRDTGPGIPLEIREHIFDPFFSGREAGRGLGFGLSKCWRIVTEHGGIITADSPPGEGAVFVIWLPLRTA